MKVIWAKQALTARGWESDVRVEIGVDGRIRSVSPGQTPEGLRTDILLPAPANAHGHAFQRAMAGLTERRGPDPRDTFWTWRKLMFRFLDQLTPEDVQDIAAFVQMEMLEAGYAANVEFHYLHHQPGGTPYSNLAEMSERIVAATEQTGIGLTLLPVHYQFGGCDGRPLGPGQIRFGNDPARFAQLWDAAADAIKALPQDAVIGVAPHSLRAVGRDSLTQTTALAQGGPIHMHLAEQVAEVEEVLAAWHLRPVEWLLKHAPPGPEWCLIHCTQMTPHETEALARSGAVAGLCPITEANLGDGIFDGVRWMHNGGRIAIGSDSNIRISLTGELRQLEYSQRLRDRSRAALATPEKSTGRVVFEQAAAGGAQAAGRGAGQIVAGGWADLLALDCSVVDLDGLQGDTLLDTFIFACDDNIVSQVWSAGRHLVQDGEHIRRNSITRSYRKVMHRLRGEL